MRLSMLVLTLAALLALPSLAGAQVQTFRKEVRQVMGMAQSQDDARAAAIAKAKRDAMEEAGTWLESQTVVKNFTVAKDEVTALASGITQTTIIKEEPFVEGSTLGIRVVAEVTVDNSGLAERIRAFLADRERLAEAKANAGREQELLARLAALEHQMAAMQNATAAEKANLRGAVQGNARQLSAQESWQKGISLYDFSNSRYTEPAQAMNHFNEALRLDPNLARAYKDRGNVYRLNKDYVRAIADFNEAIRIDPSLSGAYSGRGIIYVQTGFPVLGIADFDKAIELDPKNFAALSNRGWANTIVNRNERAIQDLDEAIRLKPDYAVAYANRGRAFANLGNRARAYQDWRKACELGRKSTCDHIRKNPE